jgi:tetratricopeptide (TPR) repeat protein
MRRLSAYASPVRRRDQVSTKRTGGGLILLAAWVMGLALAGPCMGSTKYDQAVSYMKSGNPSAAIGLLRQVLKESPRDVRAHNLMGLALAASGKLQEANTHFNKAVKLNPKFYPALKNLAINELQLKQATEAEAHLQQALKIFPGDPATNLALAEIYFQKHEFGPAVDHYIGSQGLFLRTPQTILNFARSCFESNQAAKAAGALELLGPEANGQARFQAGIMLARLEKYQAAARQFELARKDYPDPYEVGFNLTLAYVRDQDYPEAIRVAEELVSQGQRKAELYNLLAEAYERSGKTIEAYNALRTATQIEPQDEDNYLDLMALGVDHANFDLALDIANIGLRNIPHSFRLTMQRGAARAFQGQLTPALEDFKAAAKLDPQSNMPYFAMCMALMQKDQVPRALEILRQRLATNPDDYLLLYALGESADRTLGSGLVSDEEALHALERSVQLNPNLATSRIALGRIYLRRNEVDRAIPQLQRALELDPTDLSPCYQLAQAYRRKGEKQRADELFAKFVKFREEDRERHINRNLLKLLREGEK